MSFLIYFAVLVFAAASALFGLDLMTSPLPVRHHHPRPQVADTATPAKRPEQEGKTAAARALAARDEAQAKQQADRALSPVYPAAPGAPKPDGQDQAADAAKQAAPQQQAQTAAATRQPASSTTQPPETSGSAPANEAQASAPAPQPAAQQTSNHCDVQACASAYHSFNAADCTYQPFEGPRRICTKLPGGSQHMASQPRQELRRNDNGDAVRRARTMRNWDNNGAYNNDAYDDDYDDAPIVAGRSRRVIVMPPADSVDGDYYR